MSDPANLPDTTPRQRVLTARLLTYVGEAAAKDLALLTNLDDVLQELLDRGRAAWPTLEISDDAFIRHIGERLAAAPDPPRALLAVHAEDLFLACACARGSKEGIGELESRYFGDARHAVARTEPSKALQDEVMQQLREKLFVAEGGEVPKIAQYSGRGSLAGWVRMAAIRTAFSLKRGRKREVGAGGAEERLLEMPSRELNPELAQMKATYQVEFKAAFQSALGGLSPRDRNVLRLHFIDGLNIDEVGTLYRVHRSTVARWVAKSKETLLEETRRLMTERLRLSHSEFDSLMGLVRSQLDVSLIRFLDKQD